LVVAGLEAKGHTPIRFDLPCDVMDPFSLACFGWADVTVDACIHLAADKYAAHGEEQPYRVADLNITGTQNVVDAFPRVILASTCKAAAPITCYGASKLIAERIVLNAGGSVVRLVNVLGSSGSVTEIWAKVPEDEPIPVTNTERMFMQPHHAARLLVDALDLPPGRYAPNNTPTVHMGVVARRLYPGRKTVRIPVRNGDRPVEQLTNEWERRVVLDDRTVEIVDYWHDKRPWMTPLPVRGSAAA
jgi:FlaA1/EpsC-like NDP-sugar epimerase